MQKISFIKTAVKCNILAWHWQSWEMIRAQIQAKIMQNLNQKNPKNFCAYAEQKFSSISKPLQKNTKIFKTLPQQLKFS